jgi:hypothetical protein
MRKKDLVVDNELLLPLPNAQAQCTLSLHAARNAIQSGYEYSSELTAAPIKSSPVVPPCNHQSPAPRQTRSSCPIPRHRRGSRRGLWYVDGWIWGADETRKEILKHWQRKLSQSHLVLNGSQMNAWNQTRSSAVRGRRSAA